MSLSAGRNEVVNIRKSLSKSPRQRALAGRAKRWVAQKLVATDLGCWAKFRARRVVFVYRPWYIEIVWRARGLLWASAKRWRVESGFAVRATPRLSTSAKRWRAIRAPDGPVTDL